MIRKVGGPGAQYSGPIDDSPATILAKRAESVAKTVIRTAKGETDYPIKNPALSSGDNFYHKWYKK